MKKSVFLVLVSMIALAFTGCSSDDDNNHRNITGSYIYKEDLGTWIFTSTITFNQNKTWEGHTLYRTDMPGFNDRENVYSGIYTYDHPTLTVYDNDPNIETVIYIVSDDLKSIYCTGGDHWTFYKQ